MLSDGFIFSSLPRLSPTSSGVSVLQRLPCGLKRCWSQWWWLKAPHWCCPATPHQAYLHHLSSGWTAVSTKSLKHTDKLFLHWWCILCISVTQCLVLCCFLFLDLTLSLVIMCIIMIYSSQLTDPLTLPLQCSQSDALLDKISFLFYLTRDHAI